jgi:hypothetical protein
MSAPSLVRHSARNAAGRAGRLGLERVSFSSLAASSRPSGEKPSAWMASGRPTSAWSPTSERTSRGRPATFQSCTNPEWPATASMGAAGDHARAVMPSPRGVIVNATRGRSEPVANTPTDEEPTRAANCVPSGETATGGAVGVSDEQHGSPVPSRARSPKRRLPVRSHASTPPATVEVYSVVPSGLSAALRT